MEPLRQHVARLAGRMPSSAGAAVLERWLFPYEELRHGLSGYVGSTPVYWLLSHLSLIALADSPSPVGLRGDMIEFTGYRYKPGWTGGRMELYVTGGEPLFIERVTADAASAFFFQLDLIQRNEWVVEGVPVTLGGLWIAVESARQEMEELRKSGRLPRQMSTTDILADLVYTMAEGTRRRGVLSADMAYTLHAMSGAAGLLSDVPAGAYVRRLLDSSDSRPEVSALVKALASCTDAAVVTPMLRLCEALERAVVEFGDLLPARGGDADPIAELARRFRPSAPPLRGASASTPVPQGAASPTDAGEDILAKLERLSVLRDSGALSPTEYNLLKEELMKGLL